MLAITLCVSCSLLPPTLTRSREFLERCVDGKPPRIQGGHSQLRCLLIHSSRPSQCLDLLGPRCVIIVDLCHRFVARKNYSPWRNNNPSHFIRVLRSQSQELVLNSNKFDVCGFYPPKSFSSPIPKSKNNPTQKTLTMATEEAGDWKAGLTAPKADERYKTEVRYFRWGRDLEARSRWHGHGALSMCISIFGGI